MIHPSLPSPSRVSYQCRALFSKSTFLCSALWYRSGTCHSPPLPAVHLCHTGQWSDTEVWVVCFSFWLLWHAPRSAPHLASSNGTPKSGFLWSLTGTLVTGFLASPARTPVGSFLLASRGLWHLQEFPCHPLATVAPLQQCLTLSFVGEGPSSKFSPFRGTLPEPRGTSCSLYLLCLYSIEFSLILSS